jgi:hypothetical protein
MILNEETQKKYNYHPDNVGKFSVNMLVAKCDVCYNMFEKTSIKIYSARKNSNSNIDVCENKKCISHKRELTMLNKYGVKHALANKEIQKKRKSTFLKNNDYKSVFEKIKSTNRARYGADNVFETKWCKEKIKKTHEEKYGGIGYKSNIIKEKIKKTIKNKYNEECFSKTDEFKNKSKLTNKNKYGTDYYMESDDFKEKSKKTLIEKYGKDNYNQTEEFSNIIKKKTFDRIYDKIVNNIRISTLYTPTFSRNEYIGVGTKYKFLCRVCNNNFYDTLDDGNFPICNYCHPPNINTSSCENEIYSYIKTDLKIDTAQQSNRTILNNNLELDIFDSHKNVAIEINGNYWHSELSGKKDSIYHVEKTKQCEEKNIHLIQIFEDEWILNKELVKQKIKLLFNIQTEYIHARKCIIKEISQTLCDEFLDTNHIQKSCVSTTRLGLFYNNNLVSVMTFGKNRFDQNSCELIRFASQKRINGGFNKLLKFYRTNFYNGPIISYADRRWTYIHKNVYICNGFSLVSITPPNYYYVNKNNYLHRINRMNYQKQLLDNKLQYFDNNLTEWENMQLNNYDRIWDCGSLKYQII